CAAWDSSLSTHLF
nr:immunoglobulin light chain junction region [Macaca mulatta]